MRSTISAVTVLLMVFCLFTASSCKGKSEIKKQKSAYQEFMADRTEDYDALPSEVEEQIDAECANVTQAQIDKVEAKMKELNKSLVILGPEEMKMLRCSRIRKK